jgi:hypothetical protein
LQFNPPEPLTALHRLDDFECGEASLDDWIKRKSPANQSSGASRTFIVTDEEGSVRGYYAMAAGAASHRQATGGVRRDMPDPIPSWSSLGLRSAARRRDYIWAPPCCRMR